MGAALLGICALLGLISSGPVATAVPSPSPAASGIDKLRHIIVVMRRDVPTYTGKLPDIIVKTVFGCARGRYGTTLDYVSRTVEALRQSGMPDRALEALLKRCGDP